MGSSVNRLNRGIDPKTGSIVMCLLSNPSQRVACPSHNAYSPSGSLSRWCVIIEVVDGSLAINRLESCHFKIVIKDVRGEVYSRCINISVTKSYDIIVILWYANILNFFIRNTMQIVVLDDSRTVLLTIHALLVELGVPDKCISLFSDGYNALEYIEKNGADIIFSDINMPGMDGFEFVGKLLELSQRFVSMLFIVSADEHDSDIMQMKHIGAKRFLRKPINTKHFKHFVAHEIAKVNNKNQ
ncbi:response regulator, partial [bacterium]|nr:response regulator [bacterium]